MYEDHFPFLRKPDVESKRSLIFFKNNYYSILPLIHMFNKQQIYIIIVLFYLSASFTSFHILPLLLYLWFHLNIKPTKEIVLNNCHFFTNWRSDLLFIFIFENSNKNNIILKIYFLLMKFICKFNFISFFYFNRFLQLFEQTSLIL